MNKEIIKRPPDYVDYGYGLEDCYTDIWRGDFVFSMFYETAGYVYDDNISYDLKKINFIPDFTKTYKCWWYSTNPADPADPGVDILLYIEEYDEYEDRLNLRNEIIDLINKLNDNKLLKVKNYIERL